MFRLRAPDGGAGVLLCCGAASPWRPLTSGSPPGDGYARRLVQHGDVAADFRAFLDLDLGVADLAGDLARGVDDELLAHRELALEAAVDLGVVDRDRALEHAVLGDLEHARVEGRLDAAFDDQRIAVADLDALQLDVRADDQLRLAARVDLRLVPHALLW